jgi:hypothetical protein
MCGFAILPSSRNPQSLYEPKTGSTRDTIGYPPEIPSTLTGTVRPGSEIEHFRFCRQVDQMWPTVEKHVGEKVRLINLTSLGTGDSDSNRDFLLHQVSQIIVWTISGNGFAVEVPG